MAYDVKCFELATHFLPYDRALLTRHLAQHIQNSVDIWMAKNRNALIEAIFHPDRKPNALPEAEKTAKPKRRRA